MKDAVDFETHKALKEKRDKSLKAKNEKRTDFEEDDMELLGKKKTAMKPKALKSFKNNYKNFQYDYEEDLYDPEY